MARRGVSRYFRQMEPYEKQHRNTKAMASLRMERNSMKIKSGVLLGGKQEKFRD